MGCLPRILSIGYDATVLQTRNRILELAGFEVISCLRGTGAKAQFALQTFDAVVVGNCPLSTAMQLLKDFRLLNASVPVVLIYPFGEEAPEIHLADAALESLAGPESLLQTVSSVIRKSPQFAVPSKARAAAGAR